MQTFSFWYVCVKFNGWDRDQGGPCKLLINVNIPMFPDHPIRSIISRFFSHWSNMDTFGKLPIDPIWIHLDNRCVQYFFKKTWQWDTIYRTDNKFSWKSIVHLIYYQSQIGAMGTKLTKITGAKTYTIGWSCKTKISDIYE